MIGIQINTANLERAIFEFALTTRKELADATIQQAGILVGHVIALTPPGGGKGQAFTENGGISLAAKKRGEASIAADISKIFPTSKLPAERLQAMVANGWEFRTGKGHKDTVREFAESTEDLKRIHSFARNPKTGRTRKMKGIGMAVTRKGILRQYIKQEIAKVGKLNAGWVAAARKLKTASRNVPAWISRHNDRLATGGADVRKNGSKVGIRIYNTQAWFPSGMESRVALAVARRERGIQVAIEAILEKRAKAAERRMAT